MLKPSESIKNVASIVASNAVIQILSFASAPILARIYGPANFGEYQIFFSLAATAAIAISLGYEQAIIVPSDYKEAYYVLCISFLIALIFSTIITILSLVTFILLPTAFGIIILFVGSSSLLDGTINAINEWSTRNKKFHDISQRRFFSSSSGIGIKVLSGIAITSSSFGLLIGHLSEKLIFVASSFHEIMKLFMTLQWPKVKILRNTAKKYIQFPKFYLPSIFVNTLGNQMPVYLFAIFFGNTIVGLYALGNRVVSYPISLIGDALSRVFIQKIADQKSHKIDFKKTVTTSLRLLFKVGLFPTVLIILFVNKIFVVLFGVEWSMAGEYIKILSVPMLLQFCFSPLSRIFNLLGFQKEGFVINNIQIFIKLVGILAGYYIYRNDYMTIVFYSIANILSLLVYVYWFFKLIDLSFKRFLKSILSTVLITTVFSAIVFIIYQLNIFPEILNISVAGVGTVLYLIFLYKSEPILKASIHAKR